MSRSIRTLVVLTLSGILSTIAQAKSLECPAVLEAIERASSHEKAVDAINTAGVTDARAVRCLDIQDTTEGIQCFKDACAGQESASAALLRLTNRSATPPVPAPVPAPEEATASAPATTVPSGQPATPAPAQPPKDTEDRMAELERRLAALEVGECPPCDCGEEAPVPAPAAPATSADTSNCPPCPKQTECRCSDNPPASEPAGTKSLAPTESPAAIPVTPPPPGDGGSDADEPADPELDGLPDDPSDEEFDPEVRALMRAMGEE